MDRIFSNAEKVRGSEISLSLAGVFSRVFLLLGLLELLGPRREIMERSRRAWRKKPRRPESKKAKVFSAWVNWAGSVERPTVRSKIEKKWMQARLYMMSEEFVGLSLSSALMLAVYQAAILIRRAGGGFHRIPFRHCAGAA